jgi:hypothetical protein
MDGRRPFGDIKNTLNFRKRQLHEELVTHDAGAVIFFMYSFNKCNYKLCASWL